MSPSPITVLSIIGTRPEAIKMAPVVLELRRHPHLIRSVVCATGQHRQMLDQALSLFDITPDRDLKVMQPDQTLPELTARLLFSLDELVRELRPDWILAQGDTTSVLAAALVTFYQRVRFGHVEAGLRTGDLTRPFPEEMNRRVADLLAARYFAPTERARQTLIAEGVPPSHVLMSGNTVVDALRIIAARPFEFARGPLAGLDAQRVVLVTAHRRESFGAPFRELCVAIRELAEKHRAAGVQFVYPVHLNPHVRQPVQEILGGLENVRLLEPLDYLNLVHLMKHAELILTDSGGIQEEAPTFGVPVLVMRETTERPEGVEAGLARLIGASRKTIVAEADRLLSQPAARAAMSAAVNPYGDGRAAERIVASLLQVDKP